MRWALGLLLISRLAVAGADSTYAAGEAAYKAAELDVAAAQFETFVHAFAGDPRIGSVAMMWLDVLNRQHSARLSEVIEQLYALPLTGVARGQLVQLHRQVVMAKVEAVRDRDPVQAGRLIETLLVDEPDANDRFHTYYSAAIEYERAHDRTNGPRVLHAAIAEKPKDVLVPALHMRAGDLEVELDPQSAADDYLVASQFCKRCFVSGARLTAAQLYLALGQPQKAYDAATSYLADNGDDRADDAALLATTAAAQISDVLAETADRAYLRLPHPKQAAEIWLHLGLVTQQLGKRAASDRALAEAIKLTELDPNMIPIYGQALFARAEFVAADAKRVSLAVPSTKITAALQERTKRVEAALAAYEEVTGSKDPVWTIAAIDHAAHAYEDYVAALDRAEPLATDNDAERMVYRQAVASFAIKNGRGSAAKGQRGVVDGYRTAYDMANGNNYHGEYAIDAFRQLQRLDPEPYPPAPHGPFRDGDPLEPQLVQDARLDAGR